MTDMKPEDVPGDLVRLAARKFLATPGDQPGPDDLPGEDVWAEYMMSHVLAAVLPVHQQQVTAKYRRFVKTVREITKGGEAFQSPGNVDQDECTISPRELREALRDLKRGLR